jgi:hypothetical protein
MGNNNSAQSTSDSIKKNVDATQSVKPKIKSTIGSIDSLKPFRPKVESSHMVTVYSRYLDKFTLNVHMNTMDEYNITYNEAMLKICDSRVDLVIFKEIMTDNSLDRTCDIIFAIQSKFTELILCKIFIGGYCVHELTLLPGIIQWIFNGCPISFISLQYTDEISIELYNVITNDKINIDNNIYIYKMNLATDLRKEMRSTSTILHSCDSCDISDKYNVRYISGMVNIDYTKNCKEIHHFNRRPPLEKFYIKQWCLDEKEKKLLDNLKFYYEEIDKICNYST